ncbi:hypothetical protein [Paracoccus aminophilus]|uniref:Uncharacterized protein n=1 Tax=Paracoccus aminophilus JCM 7686 TaxID=1367847 RepID=S5XLC0_PARAH|nr:hypothetical protein [Paracoccus aminophilus]AGT08004.1 hypothetical protein JCM7686_0895 [Paracoccus aminophilus JCM 7686]
MIGNLTASEKRLIAALDRIDYTIERAAAGRGAPSAANAASGAAPETLRETPADEGAAALQAENQRLSAEIKEVYAKHDAMLLRLADSQQRLTEVSEQAAALAGANEALAEANRSLLARSDSGGAGPDEARASLEAEIRALRAARSAEIGKVAEIIDSLDRMLGTTPAKERGAAPSPAEAVTEKEG